MNASTLAAPVAPERLSGTLPPLTIRGRSVLPVVQGGMGVGISAHRLAGSVARLGAVGTLVERRPAAAPSGPDDGESQRRQGHRRRGEPDRARPRGSRRESAGRRPRPHRRERDARGVRIRGLRAAGVRERRRCDRRRRGPAARPARTRRRASGCRADPHPVRCARHRAGREEVGAQGPAARRDRHRASALRGRPPRRGEDRGPRRPALRFRTRAAGDARVLPRRGHRGRRDPADPRRRHQHARARARTARRWAPPPCSSARRSR